jgi:hypothetical protein
VDVERARAAIESAVFAKARFLRRWGSVAALLVVVGIILVFAAPDTGPRDEAPVGWQVAQALTFLPGFAGLGALGYWTLPFVAVGRKVLDHPAGEGRVKVRAGSIMWIDVLDPPAGTGRLVHGGGKGWPEGEAPAVLFGEPTAGGAVLAVVERTDGTADPWVAGTSRLRA